jgi:hypothetical protein
VTALTAGRNTPERIGDNRNGGMAANAVIFQGGIVARNAAGYLVAGATATGLVAVGRAEDAGDNAGGANGAASLRYRTGCFRYANSTGADEITIADVDDLAFIVDDQTVAKTNGTGARSPAGVIDGVDELGVWIRFDAPLTKIAAA